jgi:hypothetical protein
MRRRRMHIHKILVGNQKEKHHYEDLDTGGRILRWILWYGLD